MQKKIAGAFLLLLLFISPSIFGQTPTDNRFEISKNLDILNAAVKEVEMFYVDSVDVTKTVRRGLNALLSGLDPYTEYYPEEELEKLQIMATGEYGGMGALIRQKDIKEGGVIVAEPYEGMPAALAGLKAGDRFLRIDTVDVTSATSDRVSQLLKGIPNTEMKIVVQRPGVAKPLTFNLRRKQIVMNTVIYYGVRENQTGYIYLNNFTDKSGAEVKAAYEDLKNNHNIKSLIIDLRNNGGGVMETAIQIVSMFVPKGEEILSTRGKLKQWDRTYRSSVEPLDTVIPLAVLINGASASSSEILAGAMQDLDRAVLVGHRSFGKGLVQSTRDLPYDGKLKVTISKYYTPSGRCIQQLDYTHRQEDGTVKAIPDSLTNVFYTANGRPVRDGGGIRPDFEVEEDEMPTMMYYLMNDNILFDFVTDWVVKHPTIPAVPQFEINDEDFEALKAYAKEKNFTYDRQSAKALSQLKEIAEFEGYLKEDSTIFNALETKLTPNLERDFDRFKPEIKKILAGEIVKRYYYHRGEMEQNIKGDPVIAKAIEVLADPELYRKTLTAPVPEE